MGKHIVLCVFCLMGVVRFAGCASPADPAVPAPATQPAGEEMVSVVVAARNLEVGRKLADADLAVSRIPVRLIPDEFAGDIVREADKNALVDLDMAVDVAAGRIMRFSYMRGGPSKRDPPRVPKEGFRIVPIAVTRETCPPGLRSGDWVDIVAMRPGRPAVKVMERVLVKTVNGASDVETATTLPDSVGVEVREEDAYCLTAFISGGRNTVVLWGRNPDEPAKLKGFNPELRGGIVVPTGPAHD